jgi:hypothetical protein
MSFLSQYTQPDSGAQPIFYPCSLSRLKSLECEADSPFPFNDKSSLNGALHSHPLYIFVVQYRTPFKDISNTTVNQLSALSVPKTQPLISTLPHLNSSHSVVSIAARLHTGQPWNHSLILEGAKIFLFSTASRLALGPTQPSIHWVLEAHSLGIKQLAHEVHFTSM